MHDCVLHHHSDLLQLFGWMMMDDAQRSNSGVETVHSISRAVNGKLASMQQWKTESHLHHIVQRKQNDVQLL